MAELKIVTYNLRSASEDHRRPWVTRREPMTKLISGLAPDVLGIQEAVDQQLADLLEDLGDRYQLVSKHRGDNGPEENSAIIFNSCTVELKAIKHKWLSDTPDVPGSISWGNSLPRMYSQAVFQRVSDAVELSIIVTHFDHECADARLRSAYQIAEQISRLRPQYPLILMGDFNSAEETEPYAVFTESGLRDAYLCATRRGPRLGTFNNYCSPDPDGDRIDWILVTDNIQIETARIVDTAPDGKYPSDHLPVEATVKL